MRNEQHRSKGLGTRVATAAIASALGAALLLGCGGGSEVSPAEPIVDGAGFGAATIDGRDLGPTTLVVSGLRPMARQRPTFVMDEVVTFTADDQLLANSPLTTNPVVQVTGIGGAPVYVEGAMPGTGDFQLDRFTGVITREPTGTIPAAGSVEIDYEYTAELPALNIGLTFAEGHAASVDIYNLEPGQGGPVVLNLIRMGGGTGMDFDPGFSVTIETDLTLPQRERERYDVVPACSMSMDPVNCPVMNELVIDTYDARPIGNPCISGSLRVTMTGAFNPDPNNRSVVELSFDDPDCS